MLITDDTSLDKLVDIADKIFTSYNHLLNSLKPRDKKEMNCHCKKAEKINKFTPKQLQFLLNQRHLSHRKSRHHICTRSSSHNTSKPKKPTKSAGTIKNLIKMPENICKHESFTNSWFSKMDLPISEFNSHLFYVGDQQLQLLQSLSSGRV